MARDLEERKDSGTKTRTYNLCHQSWKDPWRDRASQLPPVTDGILGPELQSKLVAEAGVEPARLSCITMLPWNQDPVEIDKKEGKERALSQHLYAPAIPVVTVHSESLILLRWVLLFPFCR